MELKIKTVGNGWIVEMENDEDKSNPNIYVFQEGDNDDGVNAFAELLRFINEQVGTSSSRYDKERVYVEVRPGDKYEEPSKESV